MHRALLIARAATGAPVIVELVPVAGPELDHRVLGTRAQAAVAFAAVAARQAAACLVGRFALGQAAEHLAEIRDPLLRGDLRLLLAGGVAEIPQVQVAERDRLVLGYVCRGRFPQPGVDVLGRLLAVPHTDRHGALGRHHVAAGEHAWASGPHRRRYLHGAVPAEFHSGHLTQERGVGLLAEREDDG